MINKPDLMRPIQGGCGGGGGIHTMKGRLLQILQEIISKEKSNVTNMIFFLGGEGCSEIKAIGKEVERIIS